MPIIRYPTQRDLETLKGIIYVITFIPTGMFYIGQSKNSFYERYGKKWWKNISNVILKRHLGKYPLDNFQISILESGKSLKELNRLEKKYISKSNSIYPCGFNLINGGENCPPSQSTRNKMRKAQSKAFEFYLISKDKQIKGRNLWAFAEKHKLNYSGLNRVRNGKTLQYKGYCLPQNLNEIERTKKEYSVISPTGETFTFTKIREFAREHNLENTCLLLLLHKKLFHTKGWTIKETKGLSNQKRYKNISISNGRTIFFGLNPRELAKSLGRHITFVMRVLTKFSHKGFRVVSFDVTENLERKTIEGPDFLNQISI